MDFYDQLMAYSFLKSGSLNLLLDNLPQPAPVARYKSGSEMMAEALTGRIRSDSSMLQQGSKNATEAANIATLIANSASSIRDNLTSMLTLAQEVKADPTQGSVNSAEFKSLAQEISATISTAKYNNISLVDKSGWANDSRLTVSSDGNSSTLNIQLGYYGSKFTLNDMSYLSYLNSVDLSSSSLDIDALISSLSTNVTSANIIYSGNNSLATSYTDEAKYMVEQANILKKAADDAMPSEEDPLLRDIGSIISTTS